LFRVTSKKGLKMLIKVVKTGLVGRTGRTGNRTCIRFDWCGKPFREGTGIKPGKPEKTGDPDGLEV
jgi:hypothetical protein